MRILAIGATGFIGSHVVQQLAAQSHEIAVVHRGAGGKPGPAFPESVRHIHGDRNALSALRAEIERLAPDVVLDVVAYTEAQARELLKAVRGLAGRLVVLSSCDVYRNYDGVRRRPTAPPDPGPLAEDSPLREALYPYRGSEIPFAHREDYDKVLVERVVTGEPDLPATVLRLPAVYGPGDRQHRTRAYLRPMDDGRPVVLLDRDQARWSWTRGFVANVAQAIALAVTDARAAGRTYNVGEAPALSEQEWIEEIGRAASWSGQVVTLPADQLPKHLKHENDWRYHIVTDTRRIRDELGYAERVPPREAMEATIAWERSQAGGDPPDYAAEDAALAALRE